MAERPKTPSEKTFWKNYGTLLPVLLLLITFAGASWVSKVRARQAGISVYLIAAIERNDAQEAAQALDQGASPDTAEAGGYTCLMHETEHGSIAIVKLLLAHGADVSRRDKNGKTALMYAKERNQMEIARLLQLAGAKE